MNNIAIFYDSVSTDNTAFISPVVIAASVGIRQVKYDDVFPSRPNSLLTKPDVFEITPINKNLTDPNDDINGWLALSEDCFSFWDNDKDAVYDNL
ncbi:hypothetical protein JXQ70_20760 [bacterium]|nr:hypothetical protein [bacterium]